ncbi:MULTISPECIES: transketolase family protein [Streptomyces]|uniref:transketolase family protein n=1 Tax=Streptomyces TaxID=1883 RepID=UPI0013178C5F|nr:MULTISPECIES: transketolase C-terminal domain-containing protein [Streptomyces]QGZ50770.1 transketolase [Streptomyces sp. QHH-9511]GGT82719.1 transketolase [Streptomyces lateritius]
MSRATREAYRDALLPLLARHPELMCLDSDTGLFSADHAAAAGEQYLNLGIAEQNLMGVAAGMAACGRVPFVNTMAAFATSRALEAIKIDIAYNRLPVRIMATHGGLAAGHLGPTHQALEDLAVMRVLPGMTVVVPADAAATEAFVEQSLNLAGPLYVRLGRKATPPLPVGPPPVIGQAQTLRQGGDVVLASCGPYPVLACLAAADVLAGHGIEATVLNMHTLRPLDTETLTAAARPADLVVTLEEHWRGGGLGGAVAETLAERAPVRVVRLGVPDTFVDQVGNQEHLVAHYDLTAERVVRAVRTALDTAARSGRTDRKEHIS